MSEIALKCLAANIGASLAILAVLALRKPVRAMSGASLAYALWLLVPLVAFASLLPPRTVDVVQSLAEPVTITTATPAAPYTAAPAETAGAMRSADAPDAVTAPVMTAAAPAPVVASARLLSIDAWSLAAIIWIAGMLIMLALLLRNQSRFITDARLGVAGPAVAGFLRPHIVTPADFEQRFDARERAMILAHEAVHLARNDARINTLAALSRCLFWFNPLIHVAAHVMRIDQELACDAAVTARHPRARAVYASALLKAQLASRSLPLGCYWPPKAEHTLVERIEMLELAQPGKRARLAGIVVLFVLAIGSSAAAWAARPPVTHYTSGPVPIGADSSAPAPLQPEPLHEEPQHDEPQQTPPAQPASRETNYDPADPVYLRGKVERIFSDAKYTVFVRASSVGASEGNEAKPDKRLWELTPTPYWGDRDAVNADLKDRLIAVRGYNSKDKSCAPACKLLTRGILVPGSTELPAVASADRFGVTEVNRIYDLGQTYIIEGKVQSIRFSDRILDAYVVTPANGLVPGRVFQVRTEYRFPRADIEKQLLNQVVLVKGWPAQANLAGVDLDVWSTYSKCETGCAMYGKDFTREDGSKVAPAEDQLLPEPLSTDPFFVRLPTQMTRDTGVTLTGKVKESSSFDWGVELVVEETSRTPAPFAGPLPGTVWKIHFKPEGFDPNASNLLPWSDISKARSWIGRTVTFSGTAGPDSGSSNVRTCETNCRLLARNAMVFE
ncbi:MAG TPA: M56 family metallopeptidase [Hyphomonadaceae bacterium]|jgi:beta-lactamase regulating signal transducer with metallopeptidase domain|nr:M56 family metallopeptidase [Hyphomonadaceae bacterium]